MNFFKKNRVISFWDKQTMANHRQVWRTEERGLLSPRNRGNWGDTVVIHWLQVRSSLLLLGQEVFFPFEICNLGWLICMRTPRSGFPNFILSFIFIFKRYLFIYDCAGYSLPCTGFLWLWPAGAALQLQSTGFSLLWLLLWSMDSRAQAQSLWHADLVAPRHAGSSCTRDRTCVLSIGPWTLNHRTTRETPQLHFKWGFLYLFSYCRARSRTLPLLQFVPILLFTLLLLFLL